VLNVFAKTYLNGNRIIKLFAPLLREMVLHCYGG